MAKVIVSIHIGDLDWVLSSESQPILVVTTAGIGKVKQQMGDLFLFLCLTNKLIERF